MLNHVNVRYGSNQLKMVSLFRMIKIEIAYFYLIQLKKTFLRLLELENLAENRLLYFLI